jgi:hypothetical protein
MLAKSLTALFLALAACSLATADTPAEFKDSEKVVVKLFEAYNKGDVKGMFHDYIDVLKQNAQSMYDISFKPHQAKLGKYKKHTFIKDGSVAAGDVTLLVLDAEFEKGKAKVSVNLMKEDGKLKIQQVTIEPK